jgi:uncharacterized protein YndB with AHSA1/START domain
VARLKAIINLKAIYMNSLVVKNVININASTDKVWDALVNPEQTKKYMFGCETVSDWKPGSPLLWKGVFDGQELVAVKGTIVSIEPGKHLAYTTIDPNNSNIPDAPENYLTVTYDVAAANGHTVLTVTQGDYANVADGQKRYDETMAAGGWQSILDQIKQLLEQ